MDIVNTQNAIKKLNLIYANFDRDKGTVFLLIR